MNLRAGAQFGKYEILAPLGAGGMGEVYRARDARLGRDVAIKVLPAAFSRDPDRLARFEREARALASLNHPHIAAIYGFEDGVTADGATVHAIVLELVAGDTLAERLAQGPLPIGDVVTAARQIAAALEAAHEQGIIHRDLKPANIKMRPDGTVKVLDFGLAKTLASAEAGGPTGNEGPGSSPANSPTVASPAATVQGVVLGTAPYMSPEQARGRDVDKRTDIWAFGCVLFEMMTGRLAFSGATASDAIAAILDREPDWSSLPPGAPPGVVHLLRRCLEKDARQRLRDLGDIDLALDAPAATAVVRRGRQWVPWALAAISLVAAVGLAAATFARRPVALPGAAPMRFEIAPPPTVTVADVDVFSVSPDNRHVVFSGAGADGIRRLWVRSFDSLETRPLQGTEAQLVPLIPGIFWSPDSRSIGFYSGGAIKRVERSGGAVQLVCQVPGVSVGGSWNRDDVILVGNTVGGLLRCPANGGSASPVTAVAAGDKNVLHVFPTFLPDGRRFLYLRASRVHPAETGVFVGDLDAPVDRQPTERMLATGFSAGYVPDGPDAGYVLFVRAGTLMALPVDSRSLRATGEAQTVAQSVGTLLDGAAFNATRDVLVYREARPDYQLTWKDRRGADAGTLAEPAAYANLELSPDASRVVVGRENRLNRADRDLWIVDVARNATTRFTSDATIEGVPAWSADGTQVFYPAGTQDVELRRKPATTVREAEVVLRRSAEAPVNSQTTSLSTTPDGRFLVYVVDAPKETGSDIWMLPIAPVGKPRPLIQQDSDQSDGRVSPDGRWIAYVSNESGANEVLVRRLIDDPATGIPNVGVQVPVSRGGGFAPRWRRDGKELFFQARDGAVMAVAVSGDTFGTPAELFRAAGALPYWGVAPDGQRFLLGVPTRQTAPVLTVVLNWLSALKE